MRLPRIYCDASLIVGEAVELAEGPARHLVRVLRLRPGDRAILFNGDGLDYQATLVEASPRRCLARIQAGEDPGTESPLQIRLIQAIGRGERMDWAIQKSVELGVSAIQPLFSERTEVRLDGTRAAKRQAHWQQVAISACEQSGRARVPAVAEPISLKDLTPANHLSLYLHPLARQSPESLAGKIRAHIDLLIGPEGGLSDSEISQLEKLDYTGLRVGPRVLRTETAGPATIAALQSLFGDWR
ncbi:MAG: 16S rRNA (uracil(1498)-N(3))-methyltransferase [Wenzhouxiangella sp.]|nr:16S rRNA (uracil(1498)-N(3))-methyltransferase [Wenzhouxiangella sp.]MCH8478606.1 16S rRNA (uracil(1498)-N(3))-methyltransferase [Wenzhouxiangella sp.]